VSIKFTQRSHWTTSRSKNNEREKKTKKKENKTVTYTEAIKSKEKNFYSHKPKITKYHVVIVVLIVGVTMSFNYFLLFN
jgi:hypothetical protein